MSYIKQIWKDGDTITESKLNHIENGIEEASQSSGGAVFANVTIVINSEGTPVVTSVDKSVSELYEAAQTQTVIFKCAVNTFEGVLWSSVANVEATDSGAFIIGCAVVLLKDEGRSTEYIQVQGISMPGQQDSWRADICNEDNSNLIIIDFTVGNPKDGSSQKFDVTVPDYTISDIVYIAANNNIVFRNSLAGSTVLLPLVRVFDNIASTNNATIIAHTVAIMGYVSDIPTIMLLALTGVKTPSQNSDDWTLELIDIVDASLPSHTASDSGKVLTVTAQNNLEWATVNSVPSYSVSDVDKVLTVEELSMDDSGNRRVRLTWTPQQPSLR